MFKDTIANNIALSEFMFDTISKNLDLNKVEDKTTFVKNIVPLIQKIPNGLYKKLLKEKLLDITKISEVDLFAKEKIIDNKKSIQNDTIPNELEITDSLVLSIFLEHPALLDSFGNKIINLISNKDKKV